MRLVDILELFDEDILDHIKSIESIYNGYKILLSKNENNKLKIFLFNNGSTSILNDFNVDKDLISLYLRMTESWSEYCYIQGIVKNITENIENALG